MGDTHSTMSAILHRLSITSTISTAQSGDKSTAIYLAFHT